MPHHIEEDEEERDRSEEPEELMVLRRKADEVEELFDQQVDLAVEPEDDDDGDGYGEEPEEPLEDGLGEVFEDAVFHGDLPLLQMSTLYNKKITAHPTYHMAYANRRGSIPSRAVVTAVAADLRPFGERLVGERSVGKCFGEYRALVVAAVAYFTLRRIAFCYIFMVVDP